MIAPNDCKIVYEKEWNTVINEFDKDNDDSKIKNKNKKK